MRKISFIVFRVYEQAGAIFYPAGLKQRKQKGTDALKNNIRLSSVIKYAGAYIAFEIGSGFATGQEILQFYTSYGAMSIGAALISMIIFAWAGGSMMKIGYCAPEYETAKPYRLLCGKPAGLFFE